MTSIPPFKHWILPCDSYIYISIIDKKECHSRSSKTSSLPSEKNLNELIPSVIHGGDEFTDLTEAPSVTGNGDTQAHYCISQHRNILEEDGEKDGGIKAFPEKLFRATPSRPLENALFGTRDESCCHH